MGYTENGSATFLTSGNPCLDFFFHVVPDTPEKTLIQRLQLAWNSNPLMTLKLICNLRGVRGTGKSDKEGYYTAALWLHKHHPKTLARNVAAMANFGYFKDFPEILHRLLEGADVRKKEKEAHNRRNKRTGSTRRLTRTKMLKNKRDSTTREERIQANLKIQAVEKKNASIQRHAKKAQKAKKAIRRYERDLEFKLLHERVSDFFAESLKADLKFLSSGELKKIGLAAKWCPSLDSMFDKSTLLCESIARKVFPKEAYPEYQVIEDVHYAYRVRDRLRKEVLVPLRKALELPEVFIGANDWGSIPYNRVASVAMKQYKEYFMEKDKERFEEYLSNVKKGKATIAAGALLPHEIIAALNDDDDGLVAELQWQRMVDDLAKNGKLKNCLAVSDVSGSMSGIPMEVSVALGVLVSELSEEPWKGHVITFSENPSLQRVQGDSLKDKTEFVRDMDWGGNTDFQKVFDQILKVAVEGKLKEEQMIRRLFVFSDMEFDQASLKPWETDYRTIVRKYREKGYGNCVPEIVFWNLRNSKATPASGDEKGVALVSGFSKNLLTLFLEDNGELSPVSVMVAATSKKEYEKLVVVD
ncbi:OLC1v1016657C1 [Oldenlandia corymbosa var. corymbosa]|uniref:OLC1v1016657C1 n=1 Tax=Oldenlandia corymbosa var. corymbosa TaxID=529605 RepID=A0AAV1E7M3_OLDCO|nr:OLC1v1016657C1 [Oldenlandia corymbosa var. corymbosa]